MKALARRVAKLENRRVQQSPNRILLFDPSVPGSRDKAVAATRGGKWMLVAQWNSDADWEIAAVDQQKRLIFETQAEAQTMTKS